MEQQKPDRMSEFIFLGFLRGAESQVCVVQQLFEVSVGLKASGLSPHYH